MLHAVHSQATTILPAILGASANLAAVSAALIALIPILLQAAKTNNPIYFTYEKISRSIKVATLILICSLIFFGLSALFSIFALSYPQPVATFIAVALFFLGTIFVVCAGIAIAVMSRH